MAASLLPVLTVMDRRTLNENIGAAPAYDRAVHLQRGAPEAGAFGLSLPK